MNKCKNCKNCKKKESPIYTAPIVKDEMVIYTAPIAFKETK